jgi:hypothetical protein
MRNPARKTCVQSSKPVKTPAFLAEAIRIIQ